MFAEFLPIYSLWAIFLAGVKGLGQQSEFVKLNVENFTTAQGQALNGVMQPWPVESEPYYFFHLPEDE